jgi:hypothetical protein
VFAGKEGGKMKKILIESCSYCPDVNACNHIFLDCPLPDEPEKVKGIICIGNFKSDISSCEDKYYWWIDLIDLDDVTIEGQEIFSTEQEARQDAMEWAKKLNVEVEG